MQFSRKIKMYQHLLEMEKL